MSRYPGGPLRRRRRTPGHEIRRVEHVFITAPGLPDRRQPVQVRARNIEIRPHWNSPTPRPSPSTASRRGYLPTSSTNRRIHSDQRHQRGSSAGSPINSASGSGTPTDRPGHQDQRRRRRRDLHEHRIRRTISEDPHLHHRRKNDAAQVRLRHPTPRPSPWSRTPASGAHRDRGLRRRRLRLHQTSGSSRPRQAVQRRGLDLADAQFTSTSLTGQRLRRRRPIRDPVYSDGRTARRHPRAA